MNGKKKREPSLADYNLKLANLCRIERRLRRNGQFKEADAVLAKIVKFREVGVLLKRGGAS